MNLKELQAMIKEELDAYVNEQEVDVDVDVEVLFVISLHYCFFCKHFMCF